MVAKISKSFLVQLISYLFILLFVYASVSKLLEFQDFQTQLGQSPLLGAFAVPISFGVIGVELGLAVMLCLEKYRRIGLYGSFVLMGMFTAYIIIILNFTSFTPCSCGGVLESMGWTEHLIFNVFFIVLAAIGIYLMEGRFTRPFVYRLLGLKFIGSFVVLLIFLSSEKEIKRNNAFQRKYMPHGLEYVSKIKLDFNSYYIAGVDSEWIYLGNYFTPLYLYKYNWALTKMDKVKFELDNYEFPIKRIKTQIHDSLFYIGDGSTPILFNGRIGKWKATTYAYDQVYFLHFFPMDSNQVIFTASSTKSRNTIIGKTNKINEDLTIRLNENFLKSQGYGLFDTDGVLLWNEFKKQIIYVYYYRNQFEIGDGNLNHYKTGKTIDTIKVAKLDVGHYNKSNVQKLGKAIKVNLNASSWADILYIQSDRMGKFENDNVLKAASIIDLYSLTDYEYIGSFYFHHQPKEKIKEFKVFEDKVVALVEDELWIRKINPNYHQE